MSLFFGDFPTEDTLAPVAFLNNTMLFACPACGACVVEWQFSEANRRAHEAWHAQTESRFDKMAEALRIIANQWEQEEAATVDGGDVVKVGNWGVAPDACGPECSENHTYVEGCALVYWIDPPTRIIKPEVW
jgi:hypothetical protein